MQLKRNPSSCRVTPSPVVIGKLSMGHNCFSLPQYLFWLKDNGTVPVFLIGIQAKIKVVFDFSTKVFKEHELWSIVMSTARHTVFFQRRPVFRYDLFTWFVSCPLNSFQLHLPETVHGTAPQKHPHQLLESCTMT